jgi:hypothetical protein
MKFMVAKGHIKIVLPHLNYIYDMLHFWCQHNCGDWSKPTLITLAKLLKIFFFSRIIISRVFKFSLQNWKS